jgi:hypothetical protein
MSSVVCKVKGASGHVQQRWEQSKSKSKSKSEHNGQTSKESSFQSSRGRETCEGMDLPWRDHNVNARPNA